MWNIHPNSWFPRFPESADNFEFSAERLSENAKTEKHNPQTLSLLECMMLKKFNWIWKFGRIFQKFLNWNHLNCFAQSMQCQGCLWKASITVGQSHCARHIMPDTVCQSVTVFQCQASKPQKLLVHKLASIVFFIQVLNQLLPPENALYCTPKMTEKNKTYKNVWRLFKLAS